MPNTYVQQTEKWLLQTVEWNKKNFLKNQRKLELRLKANQREMVFMNACWRLLIGFSPLKKVYQLILTYIVSMNVHLMTISVIER